MASKNNINLKQKFFCVITGASKGIGRAITEKLAEQFLPGSLIIILARSLSGLEETKSHVLAINPNIIVIAESVDLSKPNFEKFVKVLISSLQNISIASFDVAMIIHNAGSVGDVSKKVTDLNQLNYWQEYYSLNVFGVALLNAAFFKLIGPTHNVHSDSFKTVVINITSLLAIKPLQNMGYYSSGKAAREMVFKILAEEEKNTLVLNYSPGPVKTDMIQIIIEKVGSPEVKQSFESMRDENKILSTNETTSKLLHVLQRGSFASGDHVDYFD